MQAAYLLAFKESEGARCTACQSSRTPCRLAGHPSQRVGHVHPDDRNGFHQKLPCALFQALDRLSNLIAHKPATGLDFVRLGAISGNNLPSFILQSSSDFFQQPLEPLLRHQLSRCAVHLHVCPEVDRAASLGSESCTKLVSLSPMFRHDVFSSDLDIVWPSAASQRYLLTTPSPHAVCPKSCTA